MLKSFALSVAICSEQPLREDINERARVPYV